LKNLLKNFSQKPEKFKPSGWNQKIQPKTAKKPEKA
jgi:hypothetical protein